MQLTTINKPVFEKKDFIKILKEGNYFKEMDEAIRNSPTASMAVLMFKKYCRLPNLKPEYAKLWNLIVDEKIKYGFFTLWVEFDSDYKVKQVHFRPDKNYQPKEQDDIGAISQYLNTRTDKIFPAFNSDKIIVGKQVTKAGGFGKFNGQIYQSNNTTSEYELSVFVPVFKWMGIEDDAPTHVTSAADNALFGNNIFIMAKAAETTEEADTITGETKKVSNTDRVLNALKQSKSTKKTGTNHILTVDTEKDLDKIFHKVEVGNNIDVNQFNTVDDKASKKICNAAYCFPQILANPDAGLFGNSGEAYRAALEIWEEVCYFEALRIEEAFTEIGISIQIVDEAEKDQETEDNTVDQATLDAQATLRGSVGGVTALLEVQKSYTTGATSRESAIAILKYIYGFDDVKADELLGTPVPATEPPTTDKIIVN